MVANQPGSVGGSTIGATATTESMQCYYNALRYKLKKELSDKNATDKALTDKSLDTTVYAYNGKKKKCS